MSREGPANRPHAPQGPTCGHSAALTRWAERGGPLPGKLAEHVAVCDSCAERVRRVNHVRVGLLALQTQPMPAQLPVRANSRALRMLQRALRACAEARRVLEARPNLTVRQRLVLHATRMSSGAAAAVLLLALRSGLNGGFEQTRSMGENLARDHWSRHIDPQGEWLGQFEERDADSETRC